MNGGRVQFPLGHIVATPNALSALRQEDIQLALAILADHLGDDQTALDLYQDFKWQVVAKLPEGGWKITSQEVERALRTLRCPTE